MIKYILYNLIQNALWHIKNKPDAEIIISVRISKNDGHYIEVKDTGPGIEPEVIPHLFDNFYTTNKQGGTGLGLAYCNRTMMALGGNIDCHSKLGKYTANRTTSSKHIRD
jgi:signal transduction histidine kinase